MPIARNLAVAAALLSAAALAGAGAAQERRELKPVSAFASIQNAQERSLALFGELGKVLTHPRCVNCHPAGASPLQGEDIRKHVPPVVRGDGDIGAVGMRCGTCHGQANFDPGRVPGHPKWQLAPIEMAWEGKTLGEICEQIKDPARNGGKSLEELIHHNAEDSLVGWGWDPHADREPAPGTQKAFGELTRAWVETGAACPAKDVR